MAVRFERYLQKTPDRLECIPERVERDKEQRAARCALLDVMPALPMNARILEVGPGMGWGLRQLHERYPSNEVSALTLFEEEATALRTVGWYVTVGDIHEMPADWSKLFGLVYASHILEHSPAPYIALCEIARVLRPDGYAFIVMPEPTGVTGPGNKERYKRIDSFPGHLFNASVETTIGLLRKAGLDFVSYHESRHTSEGLMCYYHRGWLARRMKHEDWERSVCQAHH